MDNWNEPSRRLMACLGDASRYRIVEHLGRTQMCVTELADALGLSQSCTTRHLQALLRDGLVHRQRAGKKVMFRLDDRNPQFRTLLEWMAGPHAAERASARADRSRADGASHRVRKATGATSTRPAAEPNPDSVTDKPRASGSDIARPPDSGKRSDANAPVADESADEAVASPPTVLRRGDLEDYLL